MNRMKRLRASCLCFFTLALVTLLPLGAAPSFAAGLTADMVILNGKILTADNPDPSKFTTAQAAAIYDGKFIAVGTNDEILQYAGDKTQKIDVGGRTVLPGLVESHDHLYDYSNHFFPPGKPRFGETDPPLSWTKDKAEFLAQIRTLALKHKPGEWIITTTRGGEMGIIPELERGDVTRFDLDKVAPNNPIHIHWNVTVDGLLNTKALDPLLQKYPGIHGITRDAKGVPNGRVGGVANLTMWYEFWPQLPPEDIGPYYKMEMEEVAAQGITTFSSRLEPNHIAGYAWLNAKKEMPLRLAYTLETFARSENTESIASRLTGFQGGSGDHIWGAGGDTMWIIGVTPDSIDGTSGPAGSCVRKEYPREVPDFPMWRFQFYGPHGLCRLNDDAYHDIDVIRMAGKYGFRVSGMHVSGDLSLDQFLNEVEASSKLYPDIPGRRWSVDHCQVVHDDQVQRAAKLGVRFSCAPKYLYGGDKSGVGAMKVLYGETEAGNSVIPFKNMIKHGVRGVIELDEHAFHPFLAMQVAITRKDVNGKVWGPDERVSRQEALYMYTRWSSEYVLKENTLGSIEPRKAADLTVLNKDYLTVPEDDIGKLDPVLTVMGGKITYSDPAFASGAGLPTVGYQGPRTRWKRGVVEDAKKGYGGGE